MRQEYDSEKPHSTGSYRGNFRGNYHNRPFYYNRRPFRGKIRPNYIRQQGGFRAFNNKYEKPIERRERSRTRSRSRERSRSRSSSSERNNLRMRSRRSYSRHSDRSESSCDDKRNPSGQRSSYDHRTRDHTPEQQRGNKSATSPDSVLSHKGSNSPRSRHSVSDNRNSRHSRSRSRERGQSRSSSHDYTYKPQVGGIDPDIGSSPTMSRRSDSSSARNSVLSNGDHTDKGKHRLESGLPSPSLTSKLNGLGPDKISQIREKKEEIEQAYKQDCETFATVVKMLISKEPSLEDAIQPSLRQNLRDIGARCIQELQDYIDQVRKDSGLK